MSFPIGWSGAEPRSQMHFAEFLFGKTLLLAAIFSFSPFDCATEVINNIIVAGRKEYRGKIILYIALVVPLSAYDNH